MILSRNIMLYAAGAGWAAAALTGWLWLNARDTIVEVREACIADQLQVELEDARRAIARQKEIHAQWRERMMQAMAQEHAALEFMEAAAASAVVKLRESQEALANANLRCLDHPADPALLRSLQ